MTEFTTLVLVITDLGIFVVFISIFIIVSRLIVIGILLTIHFRAFLYLAQQSSTNCITANAYAYY